MPFGIAALLGMQTETQTDPQITNNEFEELLTVAECARLLKVTHGWIHQKIYSGTLPFDYLKIGSYPRFPVGGGRQYLDNQLREQQLQVEERKEKAKQKAEQRRQRGAQA